MTLTAGEIQDIRRPRHDIQPLIVARWSARAMSGEPVSREQLLSLIEAARWAPSSYNNQPWRFVYVLRDSPRWDPFFALLVEGNRRWARRAGALVLVASKTTFDRDGKPSRTHAFDTGAAWENFALEATAQGLVVHAMQGFDYDGARRLLGIPQEYEVLAMIAVGHPGDPGELPADLRERERPSDRKPIAHIAFEGAFPAG